MQRLKALTIVGLFFGAIGLTTSAIGAGADIIHSGLGGGVTSFGAVGGVNAYALGSNTCNIGDTNLAWVSNGTPGLSMNAFRLNNGRLEQIGIGMVKTACCAANGSGCGLTCSPSGGGLHAGCMDTYSGGWNGIISRLAPRSIINPTTGTFGSIPPSGSLNQTIGRRLQIQQTDMSAATYPNALYFVEGQYICSEDANNGNWLNNASYSRVTVNPSTFDLTAAGSFYQTRPAIYAWQDHGGGAGVVDPNVVITPVGVPNEGRFLVGVKVTQTGRSTWHYEYAVSNFNSDRAGAAFSVPLPVGAIVSNAGFRDVAYHDEDAIYDGTDWNIVNSGWELRWQCPQTYAQNQNANALRWGTMYNFWFDCNRAPVISNAEIDLFKPAAGCAPAKVAFGLSVPGNRCSNDIVRNGAVDVVDLMAVISGWGACACPANCPANINTAGGNTSVDVNDLLAVIGAWGACP